MSNYQHILIAVDLSDCSDTVVERALTLAQMFESTVSLLHVVEYVPVEPMGEALLPTVAIADELVESAQKRLAALAARFALEAAPRGVRVGNIKAELIAAANEESADLIVLGSRERHGLAILVNFTEDTILHAAPCDVLAVRVGK